MRNKSEKKPPLKTFEVSAYRYVREEVTFEVEAVDTEDAEKKADDFLDFNDSLDWETDYEYCPDMGYSTREVEAAPPLASVTKDEFIRRLLHGQSMFERYQRSARPMKKP